MTKGARPLGVGSLLALGINGIVGVGIFFAPAEVAAHAPGALGVLVFGAVAVALVPVAIAFALLGARFGEDGGPVVFAREAFGERVAFVVGWLAYASAAFSTAATVSGLSRAVAPSLGLPDPLAARGLAVVLALTLAGVCALGLVLSARVWTTLTVLKLVPLVALAVVSVVVPVALSSPGEGASAASPPHVSSLARGALTALFAYQGFEIVPVVAGQSRAHRRAVPIAVLGSLGIAAVLYAVVQRACVRAVPDLAAASAPLADTARVLGGSAFEATVRLGTSVSALGIAFGMMTMTPRYLSALAQVSDLRGGLEDPGRRGTPPRALAVTLAAVLVLVALGELGELFNLASLAVVLQYAFTAAALVALAWRRQRDLVPLHGLVAMPALMLAAALVGSATRAEWMVALGTAGVGVALRRVLRR